MFLPASHHCSPKPVTSPSLPLCYQEIPVKISAHTHLQHQLLSFLRHRQRSLSSVSYLFFHMLILSQPRSKTGGFLASLLLPNLPSCCRTPSSWSSEALGSGICCSSGSLHPPTSITSLLPGHSTPFTEDWVPGS